ncbi:MAG: hypothetical protein ACOX4H_10935 [Bacillota bacterium]|jgi:hypothetical protein
MMPCYWNGICPYLQPAEPDMRAFERDDENINLTRQGPQPILSNPAPSRVLVLRKELTGYPNYGNPSGNADILYTRTQGIWTFNLPPLLALVLNNARRVELVIRGILDDHYNVPENRYSMTVDFNNNRQNFTQLPFVHGRPSGQRFTNWNELTVNIPPRAGRVNNRITIRNTSNAGENDWIAIDWMELRFIL